MTQEKKWSQFDSFVLKQEEGFPTNLSQTFTIDLTLDIREAQLEDFGDFCVFFSEERGG